jgi:hypothetical protein
VGKDHRTPCASVCRPVPFTMAADAGFEIIRMAHIVGAVRAPEDIDVVAHLRTTLPFDALRLLRAPFTAPRVNACLSESCNGLP